MATKLYLHAAATSVTGTLPINRHGGTAPTVQGGISPWQDGQSETLNPGSISITTANNLSMNTTKGTTQASIALTSINTTASETYYFCKWVSPPLNQTSIAANTWTLIYAAAEDGTAANFVGPSVYVYVWRPSTGALVGWISNGASVSGYAEPSGANAEKIQNCTFTGSAIASGIQAGDVIIFEFWSRITQGSNSTRVDTIYFDGATESTAATNTTVSDLASYISTPETLVFQTLTRVTTAPILKYALVARIKPVSTLKYALKVRLAVPRTLKYALKKKVTTQRTTLYALKKRIPTQRTTLYYLRKRVPTTKTLKYALKARIPAQKTLKYALKKRIPSQRTIKYGLKLRLTTQKTLVYALAVIGLSRITTQKTIKYTLKKRITIQKTTKYSLRKFVPKPATLKYALRAYVKSGTTFLRFVRASLQYVNIPYNASLDNFTAISLSCWVRRSIAPVNYGDYIQKGWGSNGGWIIYDSVSGVTFATWTTAHGNIGMTMGGGSYPLNQWRHVVGTYDGTTIYLYLDGRKSAPLTGQSGTLTSSANITIGAPILSNSFDGDLRDVRVYNVALTDTEVNTLKTGGDVTRGLVSRWKLDEGIGITAHDSVGPPNTGTLYNSPTWNTDTNALVYALKARLATQKTTLFGLKARRATQRTTIYSMKKRIPTQKIGKYALLLRIRPFETVKYNLNARVKPIKILKYAVKARRQTQKTALYAIKARTQIQRTLKYSLKKRIPTTTTARYALRLKVATQKTIKYKLTARLKKVQTIVYNVLVTGALARVQTIRIVKYNVNARLAVKPTIKYQLFKRIPTLSTTKYALRRFVTSSKVSLLFNGLSTAGGGNYAEQDTLYTGFLNRITVTAWVRYIGVEQPGNSYGGIVGNINGVVSSEFLLHQANAVLWQLQIQNVGTVNNLYSTNIYKDGNWHHFAGVYDGTQTSLYIDGIDRRDYPAAGDNNLSTNVAKTRIGCAGSGNVYHLNGNIREVRMYRAALTATEIQDIMNNNNPRTANMVTYFPMNENGGSVIYDIINGRNATLYNSPVWTAEPLTVKYALKKRIPLQRTVKYYLRARVRPVATLQYRLLKRTPKSQTLKYALRKSIQVNRTFKYALKARLASSRVLKYSMRARLRLSKTIKYSLLKRVLSSSTVLYQITKRISTLKTLEYNLYARIRTEQTLIYLLDSFTKYLRVKTSRTIKYKLLNPRFAGKRFRRELTGRSAVARRSQSSM